MLNVPIVWKKLKHSEEIKYSSKHANWFLTWLATLELPDQNFKTITTNVVGIWWGDKTTQKKRWVRRETEIQNRIERKMPDKSALTEMKNALIDRFHMTNIHREPEESPIKIFQSKKQNFRVT